MNDAELRRFEAKHVGEPNSGCWLWDAACDRRGYGCMLANGKVRRATRLAYEHYVGPMPDGSVVCHRCDVPACVNPAHLFLGTPAENSADMVAKSRQAHGERVGAAKLTAADVAEIRAMHRAGTAQHRVAAQFGITQACVSLIATRKTWAHVGVREG
jgi:hypothetical protein